MAAPAEPLVRVPVFLQGLWICRGCIKTVTHQHRTIWEYYTHVFLGFTPFPLPETGWTVPNNKASNLSQSQAENRVCSKPVSTQMGSPYRRVPGTGSTGSALQPEPGISRKTKASPKAVAARTEFVASPAPRAAHSPAPQLCHPPQTMLRSSPLPQGTLSSSLHWAPSDSINGLGWDGP